MSSELEERSGAAPGLGDDATGTRPGRRLPELLTDLLPGVVTAVVVVAALLLTDTPLGDVLRYTAYVVLAVVLPGTLVHRALRGRSSSLIVDLALGAATGLALELAAWALFTTLGVQRLLWLWPLLVVVPFLATPALRRHLRLTGGERHDEPVAAEAPAWATLDAPARFRGGLAAWVAAAAVSWYTIALAAGTWRASPLPPRANAYYEDVYWHLGIVAELTRQVPPEVPQVAGRTLHYHWFSNAHMAASHQISGVDLPTIMVRLWMVPVVAVIIGLLIALGRRLTGTTWVGAVAALVIVAPAEIMPWPWFRPYSSAAIVNGSPSQTFGLVFLLLAAYVLVDVVRGRPLGRGWIVLLLAIAAAPGSKPSVLPVLAGGVLFVLALDLLRRRSVKRLVLPLVAMGASVALYSPLVAQSAAGSSVKLLGLLSFLRPWGLYDTSQPVLPGTGGHVISGIDSRGALVMALLMVIALLLQYVVALAGLPLLRTSARFDPALWFLTGGLLAGLVGLLVVDHPGASEVYFAKTAFPFAVLLATWGLSVVPRHVAGYVVGAVLGVAVVQLAIETAPRPSAVPGYPSAVAVPLGVIALGAAIVVATGLVLRRGWPSLPRGIAATVACTALIAGCLVTGTQATVRTARADKQAALERPEAVTPAEADAARWLADQAAADDVVATNVHCKFKVTRRGCDARAFWVSSLSERRVLIEGWAYTEEALLQQGNNGRGFVTQPFDDQKLFDLNERAFTAPTKSILDQLRRDHGVRWLLADRLAGPVSPALSTLATLRLSTADAAVYQLR